MKTTIQLAAVITAAVILFAVVAYATLDYCADHSGPCHQEAARPFTRSPLIR